MNHHWYYRESTLPQHTFSLCMFWKIIIRHDHNIWVCSTHAQLNVFLLSFSWPILIDPPPPLDILSPFQSCFTNVYMLLYWGWSRKKHVILWFSLDICGYLLLWDLLNTWCNLINADFNVSCFKMFSFQTKYLNCPSSLDGDGRKKSENCISKSENQMDWSRLIKWTTAPVANIC